MLGVAGWTHTTGAAWTLRTRMINLNGDEAGAVIVSDGPWYPRVGDTLTDANGLTDVVTQVTDATHFRMRVEVGSWALGFCTITRKSSPPRRTVDLRGIVTTYDDPGKGETGIVLNGANVVHDTLTSSTSEYSAGGQWAHASVVFCSPSTDLLEIRGAHWNAPQQIKLLVNDHATNRLVITHEEGLYDEYDIVLGNAGASDLFVYPGDAVAFIRDTQGGNDRWRCRPTGVAATLLDWLVGTFANTSARYIWDADGKQLYGPYAANDPAVEYLGVRNRYQAEGARTNRVVDFDAWTLRGSCVRALFQADPLGGSAAFLFEGVANGVNDAFQNATSFAFDAATATSVLLKRVSTTGVLRVASPYNPTHGQWEIDLALLSDGWERLTADHPAVTVTNAFVSSPAGAGGMHFRGTSPTAISFYAFWPQQEEAAFPSSPMEASGAPTTRAADSMSFAPGLVSAVIRGGRWSAVVTPEHADTDLASSEVHYLYYLDASNYLSIEEDGGGNVQVNLETTGGYLARTITYARGAELTLTVDFIAGSLTVAGADTGDGTATGAVSDWPLATLYIGADSTVSNHFYGLIAEPRAVA